VTKPTHTGSRRLLYLVALLIVIFVLWPTSLLAPLKTLVVFFHEASHALTAVATGGAVIEMAIDQNQGGHVRSTGDIRFLTLTAGYLGSLMWGALIFLVTVYTDKDRVTSAVLGVLVIVIAVWFMGNLYGLGFSVAAGAGLIGLSRWGRAAVNDFVLRLIGLTSMSYAPLDIWSDTIDRSHLRSDARMLAEEFGGTTLLWGGLWIAISLGLIVWVMATSLRVKFSDR
jgi:hypothetical protein